MQFLSNSKIWLCRKLLDGPGRGQTKLDRVSVRPVLRPMSKSDSVAPLEHFKKERGFHSHYKAFRRKHISVVHSLPG